MTGTRFFRSIQFKMFIRTALMFFITLCLVEYISYQKSSEQIDKLTRDQELSLVEKHAERIEKLLNTVESDLEFLKVLPTFIEYYRNRSFDLKEEAWQNRTAIADVYEKLAKRIPAYALIRFIFKDGSEIVHVQNGHDEKKYDKIAPYFKSKELAQKKGKRREASQIVHGPIAHVPEIKADVIVFGLPLFSPNEIDPFGHIELYLDLRAISDPLQADRLFETGHLAVIADEGQILHFPGRVVGSSVNAIPGMEAYLKEVSRVGKGNRSLTLDKSYVTGFLELSKNKWKVLAFAPEAEMYSVLNKIKTTIMILGALTILFEIIVSFYFLKWVVMTPLRTLLESTQVIITGNLNRKIQIISNDELGELSDSFNTMTDSLKVSRDKLEEYGHSLEEMVKQRTKQLREAQVAITEMLNNIPYGIFTFSSQLIVNPDCSAHLFSVFKMKEIAGLSIKELIFDRTDLTEENLKQIFDTIDIGFGQDPLQLEMNSHLLPKEVVLKLDREKRQILQLDWIPLEDGNGIVNKIMIAVKDITEVRETELRLKQQGIELERIGKIIRLDASRFENWLLSSFNVLSQVTSSLKGLIESGAKPALEAVQFIFRSLHTLKGNARMYEFMDLSSAVHDIESGYSELLKTRDFGSFNAVHALGQIQELETILLEYQDVYKKKLRRSGEGGDLWELVLEDLESGKTEALYQKALEHSYPGLSEILKPVLDQLPRLAERLGKSVPEVRVTGDRVHFQKVKAGVVEGFLTHLINNSMDHGLASGTPGTIEMECSLSPASSASSSLGRFVRMTYRDSGRGLPLDKLRTKGIQQNLIHPNASEIEVANLIFNSGLSTASQLTEVSGRGVGMDAVKASIEELGGKIEVQLLPLPAEPGFKKFLFQITLPQSLVRTSKLGFKKAA